MTTRKHISLTRPQTAGKGMGQETGASSQSAQNEEAVKLIKIIVEIADGMLSDWEQNFINDIHVHPERPITGKMLFKLRDMRDKYL